MRYVLKITLKTLLKFIELNWMEIIRKRLSPQVRLSFKESKMNKKEIMKIDLVEQNQRVRVNLVQNQQLIEVL